MNRINPAKLLHSKWTAVRPNNKEKHFLVVGVEYDEDGVVVDCFLEAVMSRRKTSVCWRDLKNSAHWKQGWKREKNII